MTNGIVASCLRFVISPFSSYPSRHKPVHLLFLFELTVTLKIKNGLHFTNRLLTVK